MLQKSAYPESTFIETNLMIEKERFMRLHKAWAVSAGTSILQIPVSYESFQKRLIAVGAPWGWDKRPKYQDSKSVKSRIFDPRSKLFSLLLNNAEIGYSLTVPRDDLSMTFNRQVTEIENFGLALAFNGKGYGAPFFKHVCHDLFHSGSDAIYLSTRSTNHAKVIPFYQNLGMTVIDQHVRKNDLV